MTLGCLRALTLLERRSSGLSDPERLVLEDHLASCERCLRDAAVLSALTALAQSDDRGLTSAARDRAIQNALSMAPAKDPTPIRPPIAWSFAATVSFAVIVFFAIDDQASSLEEGDLRTSAGPIAIAAPIPSDTQLRTKGGATLELSTGRVMLSADAVIRWSEADDELRLIAGGLRIHGAAPIRVVTTRFVVEAVASRFSVGEERVEVSEGSVRVRDASGALIEELSAHERWSFEEPRAQAPVAIERIEGIEPIKPIKPIEPIEPIQPPKPTVAPSPSKKPRRSRAPAEPGRAWHERKIDLSAARRERKDDLSAARRERRDDLSAARRELASGEVANARVRIESFLRASPPRAEEAEARSLLAECALVLGDRVLAASLYRDVHRRFEEMEAGETALFASARIAAELGRRGEARASFERYLERYPKGRFREEVQARLRRL